MLMLSKYGLGNQLGGFMQVKNTTYSSSLLAFTWIFKEFEEKKRLFWTGTVKKKFKFEKEIVSFVYISNTVMQFAFV